MNCKVVTFDALAMGTGFPLNYAGFKWSGGLNVGSANYPLASSLPGTNVFLIARDIPNVPDGKAAMHRKKPFDFIGMFIATTPTIGSNQIDVEGWRKGRKVRTKHIEIDRNWRYFEFRYKKIDTLKIHTPTDNTYIDYIFVYHD